jgi:hypothetical protein
VISVWGGDRVGVRIGPSNRFGGMGDSTPGVTFPYVVRALARFGLAYLHIIEPRVTGNMSEDDKPPVAAGLLRPLFGGPVIAAGGFNAAGADAILAKGRGRPRRFRSAFSRKSGSSGKAASQSAAQSLRSRHVLLRRREGLCRLSRLRNGPAR